MRTRMKCLSISQGSQGTQGIQGGPGRAGGVFASCTLGVGVAGVVGIVGIIGLGGIGGCSSAPRPVPAGGQPVATAEGAGVVLTVPRLDSGAFPEDVLDISAAVFVAIENRGSGEVLVDPQDFTLGPPGGMGTAAVPPQMLVMREVPRPRVLDERTGALAGPVMGGGAHVGGGGVHVGGGFGGGVRVGGGMHVGGGVPVYRGGYRGGPFVYRGYGWRGPGWRYYGPGVVGWSWGWGGYPGYDWWLYGPYAPYWWGPPYYARSRDEAVRFGLTAGRLPAGGRMAGFLYFPRSGMPQGSSLVLRWQVREAQQRTVLAELQVPLVLSAE